MRGRKNQVDRRETIIFLLSAVISLVMVGSLTIFLWRPVIRRLTQRPKQEGNNPPAVDTTNSNQLTAKPLAKYLQNYLQSQSKKNYTVVINGYADIPYQEAKTKIAKKEWDIAFAYSPRF